MSFMVSLPHRCDQSMTIKGSAIHPWKAVEKNQTIIFVSKCLSNGSVNRHELAIMQDTELLHNYVLEVTRFSNMKFK